MLVAFGVGLFFFGVKSAWLYTYDYLYQSEGVFKPGETPYQFSKIQIKEIGESEKEFNSRIKANRNRIEIKQMVFDEEKGEMFIVEVEGGHRMYAVKDTIVVEKTRFNLISALGVILMVVGLFAFLFNSKFKFTSIKQH
jgi:hypothetical protein